MRKANQEITDKGVLEEILSSEQICRVAMYDGKRPYLLPFNYGYKAGGLYIHSALEGKKIDILRKFPLISFEVEQGVRIIPGRKACNWSTLYRSVIGEGTVEIVTGLGGKREGLEVIMAQHGMEGSPVFDE
ncbi:MAG: pyridoxamine 5'-phosphate oxidase family protein, partial [Bacteroidales bacterium]